MRSRLFKSLHSGLEKGNSSLGCGLCSSPAADGFEKGITKPGPPGDKRTLIGFSSAWRHTSQEFSRTVRRHFSRSRESARSHAKGIPG